MLNVFNVFLIVVLLVTLYGFYNILYTHENNKEDFLIYEPAEDRGFIYLGSTTH
jgi:hypothetical protein